ncbi:hypothetical protein RYA05_13850 [Pseudomonas syringae pv. actinidiae]|nr:hypothetical protein [Pseudomonas syringae pv. actinidiae]
MSNIAVSMDDIKEALDFTPKEELAIALVIDNLGANSASSDKFERHLAALKSKSQTELSDACVALIVKHSPSISESEGCYLDSDKTIKLDFKRALTSRLENLVASLDSALTGSNPGNSMLRARAIVADWQLAKPSAHLKHELTNQDLSIELNLSAKNLAVTPSSKLSDVKMMEASPIINELKDAIGKLAVRPTRQKSHTYSQELSM